MMRFRESSGQTNQDGPLFDPELFASLAHPNLSMSLACWGLSEPLGRPELTELLARMFGSGGVRRDSGGLTAPGRSRRSPACRGLELSEKSSNPGLVSDEASGSPAARGPAKICPLFRSILNSRRLAPTG